jgi:murein L,D-transpeptidase YcbB/YkuD
LKSVCAALVLAAHFVAWAAGPLLWFEGGQPTPQAVQAVKLLLQSGTHGLEPRDYDAQALARDVARAQEAGAEPGSAAAIDRHLTAAMERYLGDLHHGRLAPDQLPPGYLPPKPDRFDPAAVLRAAVANRRLLRAAEEAAPQLPQYQRLRDALARYRTMDGSAWQAPLPPLPPARGTPAKLVPGQPYAGMQILRERLIALGDLARQTPADPVYDDALADGVRAFQRRHGLAPDGVVGSATLAALQVPPAARAQQIELTLERLRWTPVMRGPRMVTINIPEFVLRAYDVRDGRITVRAKMKVIVGKALDTRTPLLVEQMRSIEFRPFWNVPLSIARSELVPRLRRDPGYWDREGFEFVVDGRVVGALSTELLDQTLAGRARIRQRPGPRNALGDIKFVFPNNEHIYLHHTPAVGLFARERRDFSHGCIRVEDPVALASFVLQDRPGWTEGRVRLAMTEDEPATIRLSDPLPVLIAYATAIIEGDGRIHFYDDLYGHDRRLAAALRQRRPALPSH